MHSEYTTIYTRTPRSLLFAIVANVGPGGTNRPLAVAYRQHHDAYNSHTSYPRVRHMVADTLSLIDILSDPANRAPLEAERALAKDWYRRSSGDELPTHERPSVPDTEQPPYMPMDKSREPVQQLPPLPWREDGVSQFPFSATCVLQALQRDDASTEATRPGDIQFQPLSTVFRADCLEYGLIVLDISDLDHVKYGIIAFPTCYMAEVPCEDENMDWDPVEDDQPEQVDVVLASPRPRVPLSIGQWVRKYCLWLSLDEAPRILELEERPLADAATLDYIWPPELDHHPQSSSDMVASSASSVTIAEEPLQTVPAGTTGTGRPRSA
ncbi:hypothetical protein FE257_001308 [Aspergillus nanangensis]|uniref:Uncharacterized protein n=1 Tax=Aspergillus nanangensis TaxID=2582783 RepID=A0AAD4CE15_ASPNN|nr:hypothetical protein FE257_001308 [Aspergillus nanangensis]